MKLFFCDILLLMKLFVDIDDTLIMHKLPSSFNWGLVDAITKFVRSFDVPLVIWSGTGEDYAKKYSNVFFPIVKQVVAAGAKNNPVLLDSVKSTDVAIDDRPKQTRDYLKNFGLVYLPHQFLELAEESWYNKVWI